MIVQYDKVSGNDLIVEVSEIVAGSAATDIMQSPFDVTVFPNVTNAAYTTAFGPGLVYGVTGVTSKFRIQAKDAYGNNRLNSQPRDIFKVHAFISSMDFDQVGAAVEGHVVYAGDDLNGGAYDVEFTPTLSGLYTIAVMHGDFLEVQNISTSWSSVSAQSGYFTLTFGPCNNTIPCPRTKQIAWNANGDELKEALQVLPGIGDIAVTFTQTSDLLNSAWAVTFLSACDFPQIGFFEGTVPIRISTIQDGRCSMIKSTNQSLSFPYANTQLVEQVQTVTVGCSTAPTTPCIFELFFPWGNNNTIS